MTEAGIALEAAMVDALEGVDGLAERVSPILDIRLSTGPLAVYDQRRESRERDIGGATELMHAEVQLHLLHNSYMEMRLLAEKAKRAVEAMEGLQKKPLLVEAVEVEQSTPDLLEERVGLFRRTYTINFYYQIKEE